MSRYKIVVRTIQGHILTFHVSKYTVSHGDFIEFVDEKTRKLKRFHASHCEIEEVEKR